MWLLSGNPHTKNHLDLFRSYVTNVPERCICTTHSINKTVTVVRYRWHRTKWSETKRCQNARLILALRLHALSWFSQSFITRNRPVLCRDSRVLKLNIAAKLQHEKMSVCCTGVYHYKKHWIWTLQYNQILMAEVFAVCIYHRECVQVYLKRHISQCLGKVVCLQTVPVVEMLSHKHCHLQRN